MVFEGCPAAFRLAVRSLAYPREARNMADYEKSTIDGFDYDTPVSVKPRKKQPPFIVVMNENCTSCSGSPACLPECPVACIHRMYEDGRPVRVYVDNDICIGCMNCFSDHYRPKSIMKGEYFSPVNVTAKRPGDKRSPMEYWDLMGRIAERNYDADDWL